MCSDQLDLQCKTDKFDVDKLSAVNDADYNANCTVGYKTTCKQNRCQDAMAWTEDHLRSHPTEDMKRPCIHTDKEKGSSAGKCQGTELTKMKMLVTK